MHHRRRRCRAFGRGLRGGVRRIDRPDRTGGDGRRMPEHGLRALEGAHRRGACDEAGSAGVAVAGGGGRARLRARARLGACEGCHFRDRARGFGGTLCRARGRSDQGRGGVHRQNDGRSGRQAHQGAPLRDRFGIEALDPSRSLGSMPSPTSRTRRCSHCPNGPAISS